MTFKTFAMLTRCPHCGKRCDCASNTESDHQPGDGDATLCIDCGKWGFFDAKVKGGIRKATASEAVELVTNTHMFRVKLAWSMIDRKRVKRIGEK